jgi:hypothetical protein
MIEVESKTESKFSYAKSKILQTSSDQKKAGERHFGDPFAEEGTAKTWVGGSNTLNKLNL